MRIPIMLKRIGGDEEMNGGLLYRAFRRFRLPLREKVDLEQAAARNRARQLFQVNFRSPWTR